MCFHEEFSYAWVNSDLVGVLVGHNFSAHDLVGIRNEGCGTRCLCLVQRIGDRSQAVERPLKLLMLGEQRLHTGGGKDPAPDRMSRPQSPQSVENDGNINGLL